MKHGISEVSERKFAEMFDNIQNGFYCFLCKKYHKTTEDFPKIYKESFFCENCYPKFLKNNKDKYTALPTYKVINYRDYGKMRVKGVKPDRTFNISDMNY